MESFCNEVRSAGGRKGGEFLPRDDAFARGAATPSHDEGGLSFFHTLYLLEAFLLEGGEGRRVPSARRARDTSRSLLAYIHISPRTCAEYGIAQLGGILSCRWRKTPAAVSACSLRSELWSPSTMMISFGPAYFS